MLHFAHSLAEQALGSVLHSSAKLAKQDRARADFFSVLPDDLLSSVIALLDVKCLLALQQCDRRMQRLASSEKLWRTVFMGRFGLPSNMQETAHKLAGSWQALYKSKVLTDQAAGQWRKPSPFELQAALHTMLHSGPTATCSAAAASAADATCSTPQRTMELDAPTDTEQPAAASPDHPVSSTSSGSVLSSSGSIDSGVMNNAQEVPWKTQLGVVFLLDSSGSVGDEDFTCMTQFLDTAAQAIAGVDHCKVCVVQFSNDTRVEVPLGPLDKPTFDAAVSSMVRLNGGTNIAAAVAKAGALLKADEADCSSTMRRVLVLLTDGRIDSYQAREAASMVARLSDEQAHVALWAFGVGRGVDSAELMRIIEGPGEVCRGLGRERYMDLCVRDDAPW